MIRGLTRDKRDFEKDEDYDEKDEDEKDEDEKDEDEKDREKQSDQTTANINNTASASLLLTVPDKLSLSSMADLCMYHDLFNGIPQAQHIRGIYEQNAAKCVRDATAKVDVLRALFEHAQMNLSACQVAHLKCSEAKINVDEFYEVSVSRKKQRQIGGSHADMHDNDADNSDDNADKSLMMIMMLMPLRYCSMRTNGKPRHKQKSKGLYRIGEFRLVSPKTFLKTAKLSGECVTYAMHTLLCKDNSEQVC
jgi:hypothetical protein